MFPPGTDQENQKSSFSLTQIHQETVVKILNIHGNTRYTMRHEDVNIVNGFLTAQFRQQHSPVHCPATVQAVILLSSLF